MTPARASSSWAATNRPEVLDKALLRPGRFDRRITVDRPNLAGRLATLQVHTRNIQLAEDVDLKKIAQATAGCVGADLANLVNEAALRAVRMGRKAVNQKDLLASFEMVIAGSREEGHRAHRAGEEASSPITRWATPWWRPQQKNTEPVSKITIVPHTQGALGYTLQTAGGGEVPQHQGGAAGRDPHACWAAAPPRRWCSHTMTTGASNDIERATDLARKMVTMFGMSDELRHDGSGHRPEPVSGRQLRP